VKRCCGERRGPSEAELARASLAHAARQAAFRLAHATPAELAALCKAFLDLPALDLSVQVPLPELVTPELERLRAAMVEDDAEAVHEALGPVLAEVDTPETRALLAERVVALRDAGRVDADVAAAAVINLDSPSRAFLRASLVEAVAVAAGLARTPSGLLVAAA
jgi:hypothetical protein